MTIHQARPGETLCSRFQEAAARLADQVALDTLEEGHPAVTWRGYAGMVEQTAGVLAGLGVEHGGCVAMLLSTRVEFHWFDLAVLHLGARTVSVYNTAPAAFIEHLLTSSGATVLVTERAYLEQARAAAHLVEHVVVLDEDAGRPWAWADMANQVPDDFDFNARWQAVAPSDLATMIYTSGTTGAAKGVQLTHGNIVWAVGTYMETMQLPLGAEQLSFLPMAHIAARNMDHYGQILRGFRVTLLGDHTDVLDGIARVRPSLFFSPPRVWEKLRSRIEEAIASEPDSTRREAWSSAVARGLARVGGEEAPLDDIERSLLREVRSLAGLDRIAAAIVGGAPVARELVEFFHAIDVPLGESYGMSENAGVCTTNPPGGVRFGTIGISIPGQQVRLADDGELLIRGPGVMAGYRGMPEATAEAIDEDGWLHSGDLATQDADGYLTIVGRKKELIINSAGKNMAPALIEAEIVRAGRFVATAVAVGDGRPYVTALLLLDHGAAARFAAEHGLPGSTPEALAAHPLVLQAVAEDVAEANRHLARVEQVKRFHLVADSWVAGGPELTATHKVRRQGVIERYHAEISALYQDQLAKSGGAR